MSSSLMVPEGTKGVVSATTTGPVAIPLPVPVPPSVFRFADVKGRPPKHYVVVRTDMPLHVQMVQVAHAALQAGAKFGVPEYAHLSLVSVPNAHALEDVIQACCYADVLLYVFYEPDDNWGNTAFCTGAIDGPPPPCLRRLPLWKAP